MNEVLAVLIAILGGLAGGLVGVGGGVLFVPALTIFLGLSQVEGESTSLMMIVIVAFVGAYRQRGYGNLNISDALWIGALSPIGVLDRSRDRQRGPGAGARTRLRGAGPVRRLHARAPGAVRGRGTSARWRCRAPSVVSIVDSLTWETDVPALRSPILVCSFRGWNDAAGAASTALAALAIRARRRADRPGRSRGLLRLPGDAADDHPHRGTGPPHRVAPEQPDRGPGPRRRARPGPARRDRAEPALAHLLGDDRYRRRHARGRDGGHAGRADRRGLAHAAGADHRPRLRPRPGRRPRAAALQLRRPDRDRRRRPRLLPPGRDHLGLALGGGAPLRRRRPQPEGRRWRCCAGSRA